MASASAGETLEPTLFSAVTERSRGPRGAWRRAAVAAVAVHAVLLSVALAVPTQTSNPEPKPEPELVFVQFSPAPASAPPALVAVAATAQPVAQVAPPRPRPVARPRAELVAPVQVPAPVEPEVLPELELSAPTEVAAHAAALTGQLDGLASAAVSGMGIGGTTAGVGTGPGGNGVGTLGDAPVPAAQLAHPPRVLREVPADYPRWARRSGITGRVVVRLIIDTEGRVESDSLRVLRSVPELDEAALAAARQWRFSPGSTAAGQRVRVMVDIPFQFSLR